MQTSLFSMDLPVHACRLLLLIINSSAAILHGYMPAGIIIVDYQYKCPYLLELHVVLVHARRRRQLAQARRGGLAVKGPDAAHHRLHAAAARAISITPGHCRLSALRQVEVQHAGPPLHALRGGHVHHHLAPRLVGHLGAVKVALVALQWVWGVGGWV